MKTVSPELVEQTWQRMADMSPDEIPVLMNTFVAEQPAVVAFLMAAGEDLLNQDEKEFLLYLGVTVWQIMQQGSRPLSEVSEKALEAMVDSNFKMLEYLEGESEFDFTDTVATIYSSYNQPEVLRYVLEALFEEDEEVSENIREEMKGMIFVYLKTIIDSFDK